MSDKVRLGVAGTSWWADAMYLPALTQHPLADVRAVAGGSRPDHTREFATRWGVPAAYDSLDEMLDAESLDAVVVLTPNANHFASTMAALGRGLHVLCEKPLGMSSSEARRMAEAAEAAGVTTMTPFTYRFMPANRYLKELLDEGYLGRPHHLNFRYYSGYGRSGDYAWRFDLGEAGSGVSGDLGAHWAYMARWYFGEVVAVTSVFSHVVPRGPRPDGRPFAVADDGAIIALEFENGATGVLHVSSLAWEPGPFGQRHEMDLHGSGGTLRSVTDWLTGPARHGWRHLPRHVPPPRRDGPRLRVRDRGRHAGLAGLPRRAGRAAGAGRVGPQRRRGPPRDDRRDRRRRGLIAAGA